MRSLGQTPFAVCTNWGAGLLHSTRRVNLKIYSSTGFPIILRGTGLVQCVWLVCGSRGWRVPWERAEVGRGQYYVGVAGGRDLAGRN
jgi:hypothetical protein